MQVIDFVFGPIKTNCYLVVCEQNLEAMVIDPDVRKKEEKEILLDTIKQQNLVLRYIVNTHHHSDHTAGNGILKKATGAEILVHELDAAVLPEPWEWWSSMIEADPSRPCPVCGNQGVFLEIIKEKGKAIMGCRACGFKFEIIASPPPDRLLHDGDVIKVGKLGFDVIHTPGHSKGGISLYAKKESVVFTGDTLFNGSVGRTDTIDGSFEDIIKSVQKLMKLPDDTNVYPGHGERTTIGKQKHGNPHVHI
jgi:hydroxyacylglutathione hydrolase